MKNNLQQHWMHVGAIIGLSLVLVAVSFISSSISSLKTEAGCAYKVVFENPPMGLVQGTPFTLHASIRNCGVLDTNDNGRLVTIGFDPAYGIPNAPTVLSGTLTRPTVNGVATFDDISINNGGIYYVLATTKGIESGGPAYLPIAHDTSLVFTTQPEDSSTVVAGENIPLELHIVNQNGQLDTSANDQVTLAPAFGGPALFGSLTAQAVNGVATFSGVSVHTVRSDIRIVATSPTVNSATTHTFSVIPGAPSRLDIYSAPSGAVVGQPFSAIFHIVDQYGNDSSDGEYNVSIALGSNSGGGTLSGTLMHTSDGGEVQYTNLSINAPGTYDLVASAPGLGSVTTKPFSVRAAGGGTLQSSQKVPNTASQQPVGAPGKNR